MFTGIVEEMGAVSSMEQTLAGTRLTILASKVLGDLNIGDSVSINGTCLTVAGRGEQSFVVEVSPETLSVTTLGRLAGGGEEPTGDTAVMARTGISADNAGGPPPTGASSGTSLRIVASAAMAIRCWRFA